MIDIVREAIEERTTVDYEDVRDWLTTNDCGCPGRAEKRELLQRWARNVKRGLITDPDRYLRIIIES